MYLHIFIIKIYIILLSALICSSNKYDKYDSDYCEKKVHRLCNTDQTYTEFDVIRAQYYLQKRFAKTNPIRKPCARLHVRKDIKCLSKSEVIDLIIVFKELYANGVIDRFAALHDQYWPAAHKFQEGINWHRWFENEFEKEMLKINPKVTLPYWENYSEFKSAQKSIVFDYFGHAGSKENDYCITDGPFANITVNYPEKHCVRRQWNKDGSIPLWEPPEWKTAILQMGTIPQVVRGSLFKFFQFAATPKEELDLITLALREMSSNWGPVQLYNQFAQLAAFSGHFKQHLAMGGYYGDLSVSYAPNDIIFYLFHVFFDFDQLKWQLQNNENLVPESYNFGLKLDNLTQQILLTDIDKDNLTYYDNITIRETFQIGYGELCYIYDGMIKPINDIMKNKEYRLPMAVQRLKTSLPPGKFEFYFPKFALYPKSVSYFDSLLPDVGNCNSRYTQEFCKQIPIAKRYTDTPNSLRQWNRFVTDANNNITLAVYQSEVFYEEFITDLNYHNYCSPYI